VKNDAHPNIYCKTIIFVNGLFIDRTQFNVNKVPKTNSFFWASNLLMHNTQSVENSNSKD
jgi:G:T-mismatch repair DNA endonuclease (very short patch repair protein)